MISIEEILNRSPAQSSEIVKKLIKHNRISSVAARQRLSRAKGAVMRLDDINLPNREKIYYLEDQYGSEFFFEMVSKILIKNNAAAGRGLLALSAKDGVLPLTLFSKASGTTFYKSKKQINVKNVLNQLKGAGLISFLPNDTYGNLICRYDRTDLTTRQRASLEVERVFLAIIKSWLANLGISSFGALKIRDVIPHAYGPYHWDLVGPCYLSGIAGFSKGKYLNGFVVGDIILDKIISKSDILPFIFKVDSLVNQKKIRPFLAIYIADLFSPEALNILRKKGIIIARPDTVLGKEYAELVKSLINTLEDASNNLKKNPNDVFNLLNKLSKIEGAALNLRSVILDFIIARLYDLEGFDCDIRQRIQLSSGDRAEVDVIASRKDKVVFIEGKALSPTNQLNADEIKKWIDKTYPKIKKFIKEQGNFPPDTSIEFCISTAFHSDSKAFIKKVKKKYKKLPIKFSNGSDLIKRLRKFRQSSVVDLFREHFVKI
jgi:hypothetical protein